MISSPTSLYLSWEAPTLQTGPTKYKVIATDVVNSSITSNCNTEGIEHFNILIPVHKKRIVYIH